MNCLKKFSFLLIFVCASSSLCFGNDNADTMSEKRAQRVKDKKERLIHSRSTRAFRSTLAPRTYSDRRITHILGDFCYDIYRINIGLFSWDSFKIFAVTTPFYVASRMIDDKLQNCFFDHVGKKNRNEPAQWCKEIARWSIGVPIALLGGQAILSRDEDMRITSQVFLEGMPFVLIAKDLIKKMDFEMCKRPYHEKFSKEQRCYGGFPSGHLAEATYMAVLYGMRYGPKFALPLGSVAAFVTAVFLTSNRHYLSQMIAGAGFGAMYAFSANSLINSKLAKNRDLAFGLAAENGGLAMNLSFRF